MATSHNNLNLDRDKIHDAICEFAVGMDVSGPTKRDKFDEYVIAQTGQLPAHLQIFYRKDGSTTLNARVGKNQSLSSACADHVALRCRVAAFEPLPVRLNYISEDHWKDLQEFLAAESVVLTNEDHSHAHRLQARLGDHDIVYLHRYHTGTFVMQGRPRRLYGEVVSLLCALLPDRRDVIANQLAALRVALTVDELMAETRKRLPHVFDYLGETLTEICAPSLALGSLRIELPDYTAFVFPALRGLEGYLKRMFLQHGYEIQNAEGLGSYFNGGSLRPGLAIATAFRDAIQDSYKVHRKHRNGLFHVDGTPDTSRIIEHVEEARSIIDEVFSTIDSTYARAIS